MTAHIDEWAWLRSEEYERWVCLIEVLSVNGQEGTVPWVGFHAIVNEHAVDPTVFVWILRSTVRR